MKFLPTEIPGVVLVEPEPVADDRGHFARWYCAEDFAAQGLELPVAQGGVSRNSLKATLRGLHFIAESDGEAKLVRCVSGSIYDVGVDLRPRSSHFGKWFGVELSAGDHKALYLPRGCAHGFITLEDNVDVVYQMSRPYRPDVEAGVRWDDPKLAISWPFDPRVISERDRVLPLLTEIESAGVI